LKKYKKGIKGIIERTFFFFKGKQDIDPCFIFLRDRIKGRG